MVNVAPMHLPKVVARDVLIQGPPLYMHACACVPGQMTSVLGQTIPTIFRWNRRNRLTWLRRRAIARMVEEHLEEQEKRPWLKNVKTHAQDEPFLRELVAPAKKKLKRRKRKSETK
jgi:hypothetical protein